ncbi:MAG: hypothetical protein ACXIU7_00470 [Roseinatronobacter sp.]
MTQGACPLIDLKTAHEQARAALDLADQGEDRADQRKEELRQRAQQVFEVICTRFLELHAKAHTVKSRHTERLLHTHVVPEWKSKPIDTLDRAGVAERDFNGTCHMPLGSGAARGVRKHITKVFDCGVDRGLLAASRITAMRRPKLGYVARERVLSMDEPKAIWAAAAKMGHPVGPMMKLPIVTAHRRAEIVTLEDGSLLSGQQAFEVPAKHDKTDRPQVVPLSSPVLAIVEALPNWNGGDFLLSTTAGKVPVPGFSKPKASIDKLAQV